jgi:hypothetical protein
MEGRCETEIIPVCVLYLYKYAGQGPLDELSCVCKYKRKVPVPESDSFQSKHPIPSCLDNISILALDKQV